MAVALIVLLRRRLGTFLHPCLLLGGFFVVYGLCGYLLYPLVYSHGPTPLRSSVSGGGASIGSEAELRALMAFTLFGLAPLLIAAALSRPVRTGRNLRIDFGERPAVVRWGVMAFLFVVAVAFLAGVDLHSLFHRYGYQEFSGGNQEAYRLGNGLLIPAILVAWTLALSQRASPFERTFGFAAVILFAFFDLATASRGLALFPLLFLLAFSLTRGRLPSMKVIVPGVAVALLLFAAALFLRTLPEQGMSPYLHALINDPSTVFTSKIPQAGANVLGGFQNSAKVMAEAQNVNLHTLWSSINPLPRSTQGADPTLAYRFTSYMPFSTVGMLGRIAIPIGFAFYLLLALAINWLWEIGHRTVSRATLVEPVLLGMSLIVALMSIQYQLRTTARVATFALLLVAILLVGFHLREREPDTGPASRRLPTPVA
ncbi:MAG TPA: hypothetical protein VHZ54_13815 [Solirubrobacterales bacterium]|nr:hypothetical protein [Solirubrobacterales bacterium]